MADASVGMFSGWSFGIRTVYKKGARITSFAAAAGLTYFLPVKPCSFLNRTMPTSEINATNMKHCGAAKGKIDPSTEPITGVPSEYERATIMPNTAADMVFNGLSETVLYNRPSIATAIPTAIMQFKPSVRPRLRKSVFVTGSKVGACDHITIVIIAIAKSATKV